MPARRFCCILLFAITIPSTACDSFRARFGGYPGRKVAVEFQNDSVRLHGLLLYPRGTGPFPAIVLVHGSGHWVIEDNTAWKAHARAFLKHGFAVLVYDKRGSGASGGNLEAADYQDLAGDVVAAVGLVRQRAEVQPDAIGLFGYSEGGWVTPLAARLLEQRHQNVAFIVMTSGPAVSPATQTLFANEMAMREGGARPALIRAANAKLTAAWDSVARAGSSALARRIFFDPVPLLKALPCPLLAVYGARDDVVNARESATILRRLQQQGRNIAVRVYPGVGHSIVDKNRLVPRYAPGYLDYIGTWAARQAARDATSI